MKDWKKIEKEFELLYGNFPTSAHWYKSVLNFIKNLLNQQEKELKLKSINEKIEIYKSVPEVFWYDIYDEGSKHSEIEEWQEENIQDLQKQREELISP